MLCCVFVSIYLSARITKSAFSLAGNQGLPSSLHHHYHYLIIARVSQSSKVIQVLQLLSHLKLEIPSQSNQLLQKGQNKQLRNTKKEEAKKEVKKTHRSCAWSQGITHDNRISRHGTLPSKAIRAISIDHPRQLRRIDRNTRRRGNLVQVLHLSVTIFQNAKEENRNEKRWKKKHTSTVRKGMRRVHLTSSQSNSFLTQLAQATLGLHKAYLALVMESRASMIASGSIGTCGASSPTNWQCTHSAK